MVFGILTRGDLERVERNLEREPKFIFYLS